MSRLSLAALAASLAFGCALVAHADIVAATVANADLVAPTVAPLTGVLALFGAAPWLVYVLIAGTALPWLAALLPQATPGTPWATVRGILDVLAANVGNAANATLATPQMAARAAAPIPATLFGVEHLIQAYALGQAATTAPAAAPPATTAPAAPATSATGAVATALGAVALLSVAG